jgi:iron complex transport system substrate-binding protein
MQASRRALAVLTAVGALVALAACGDDDSPSAATTAATATTAASTTAAATGVGSEGSERGEWPVTIEHRFGSTTLEERPERIVTLDLQWTDAVLALGETPVGYVHDDLAGPSGTFPWQGELLADVTAIEAGDALPLERIAELRPDLILVGYYGVEEDRFDDLAAIAPTIGLLGEKDVDAWQDQIEVVGKLLGKTDAAAAKVKEVAADVTAVASELPGLQGKTFAMANFVPGDSIYVVANPQDGSNVLFGDLGLEIDPGILALADGVSGRAQLSLEQADLLASDLLVLFTNGADPNDLVGYGQLPAVQNGSVAVLDYVGVVGLNTPTPLSIAYSLDLITPALEAVAGNH